MAVSFEQLLKTTVERGGNELYVGLNTPAQIRIDGTFVPLDMPVLSNTEVRKMLAGFLRESDWSDVERGNPVTRGMQVRGLAQFRLTVYSTVQGVAATAKMIPYEILGFRELGLPEELGILPAGLTLIGGPPDSGRSTSLAAVVDKTNRETHCHITLFAPEVGTLRHQHKNSIVDHVVFTETPTGARRAAEIALWGSADVVAFDEVYGIEALRTMIHLAHVGLRVVATVPGRKTVRDVFDAMFSLLPPFVRPTVQAELAYVLRRVMAQMLLPKATKGRVMAFEMLDVDDAARSAIERGQLVVIDRAIAGGMSMNDSLARLQVVNAITSRTASAAASDAKGLEKAIDDARKAPASARRRRQS